MVDDSRNRRAAADLTDLDTAIALTERALAVAADRTAANSTRIRLATYYFDRYRDSHDLKDLDRAVEIHERVLSVLGTSDPERLVLLANLALEYGARLAVNPALVARDAPHSLASQIEQVEGGPPSHRIQAFRHIGMLASGMGDDTTAAELLARAVHLLPNVVSPENEVQDREHLVGGHAGLVEEAIAAHCRAGDPRGAIKVSETGRGIVLPILPGAKRDLTALQDQHPDLAAKFLRLRRTLSRPHGVQLGATSEQVLGSRPFEAADRLQWQRMYNQLTGEIRQLPGFEHFLLPADPGDLRGVAKGCAVVLINVDRRGGDAVIVKPDDDPLRIPLPDLHLADVQFNGQRILDAAHFGTGLTGWAMKLEVLPSVLAWLWKTIVDPVLTALPPHPRIWWMPTGALTLFPLHAAGVTGHLGALDLALSSYTSTLRALAWTRTSEVESGRRQLTVILEQTPGMPDLPAVRQEAETLHASYPDALRLRGRAATVGRVMSELSKSTWVHFACHATADYVAPSRGGLHLADGMLTVTDISPLLLHHAELAYLSACSTANRGVRYANESITPASAFQLAGFRHIIASLWPLEDSDAAMVAGAFYNKMPDDPVADLASDVLRQVALELRSEHPNRPDLWAPLVHIGP